MPTPKSGLLCIFCGATATRSVGNGGYCETHIEAAREHRTDVGKFVEFAGGRAEAFRLKKRLGIKNIPRTHHAHVDTPAGQPSAYEYELLQELKELES